MRYCIKILFLVFFAAFANVESLALTPQAKVSLLTVSRGDDLYSSFGHSAFWFYDPAEGLDRVYNYGTFDFDPDFYAKFVRGKLDYRLSVSDFNYLLQNAQEEKRTVIAQILNLSPSQKEALLKFLENNYLPENRYYRYDFFYDNCSSRLRDGLLTACGDSLRYDLSENLNLSFRQMIDQYLLDKEIQDLGMDIGLGAPADVKATPFQYMFLPDYLKTAFDKASIYNEGIWQPLVMNTEIMYDAKITRVSKGFQPALLFWALAVFTVFLTYRNFRQGQKSFAIDATLLIILGTLGCVLVFLWFFTDHNVTVKNWNLWWATPLHLPIAILLVRKAAPNFLRWYFLVYGIVCLLLVLGWVWWPEEFNKAVFPLLIILIVRALYMSQYFKKKAQ